MNSSRVGPVAGELREAANVAPVEEGTDQKEAEGGGASDPEARLTGPDAGVAGPVETVTGPEVVVACSEAGVAGPGEGLAAA